MCFKQTQHLDFRSKSKGPWDGPLSTVVATATPEIIPNTCRCAIKEACGKQLRQLRPRRLLTRLSSFPPGASALHTDTCSEGPAALVTQRCHRCRKHKSPTDRYGRSGCMLGECGENCSGLVVHPKVSDFCTETQVLIQQLQTWQWMWFIDMVSTPRPSVVGCTKLAWTQQSSNRTK